MAPQAEQSAEQELEAKLFAARKLEDPSATVRVDWGNAWSDDGERALEKVNGKLRAVLERLGVAEIDTGRVKEFAAGNSAARLPESGQITFPEVCERLADSVAAMADYPNDFTYTFRLAFSEDLDVVVEFTSEEAGTICGECTSADTAPGESCEHYQGQYDIRHAYRVHLVRTDHHFVPGCYSGGRF